MSAGKSEHTMEAAIDRFNRATSDTGELNELMLDAYRRCHLVSPATSCGRVPEGFTVAISTVVVDIERETYPAVPDDDEKKSIVRHGDVDGRDRSLSKVALNRIANAAGVSWDDEKCRLLSKELHYRHYKAVGSYKHFDNHDVTITGEKEIDLRDGSVLAGKISTKRLLQERINILSNCETKAKLRALREMGIRSSYTREELMMPFVIARLMFTGQSSDPALRREFAMMIARRALGVGGAHEKLYGRPADAPPATEDPEAHPPPPVAAAAAPPPPEPACAYCGSLDDVDAFEAEAGKTIHCCRHPSCVQLARRDGGKPKDSARGAPPPPTAPAQKPPPAASSTSRSGAAGARGATEKPKLSGFFIPGGDERGTPIEEASDSAVRWWERLLDRKFRAGDVDDRYLEKDTKLLAALVAELKRRDEADNIPF